MSQTISAPPRPRASREPAGEHRRPVTPPHVWIYRQLTSMRVALVLLFVLALLTLAGTLLVQAPAAVKGDPRAYADWLDSVRPKYGGWTGILDTFGLFSVFSSIWFKGIAAAPLGQPDHLLGAQRAPPLEGRDAAADGDDRGVLRPGAAEGQDRLGGRPRTLPSPCCGPPSAHTTSGPPSSATATTSTSAPTASAGRRSGRIVAHLSFVVILVGAVAHRDGRLPGRSVRRPGRREGGGRQRDRPGGRGEVVRRLLLHERRAERLREQARPLQGRRPGGAQEIRVNHPMSYDGVDLLPVVLRPRRGDAGEGERRPGRLRPGRAAAVRVQGRKAPRRPASCSQSRA